MRWLLNLLGLMFVGIGIAGIFLPVLPTTIFWIIAAVIFARSNPEWEARIMNHPKYGPPIQAYRERGVIGRRSKIAAVIGMIISSVIGFVTLTGTWGFLPAGICALCAVYVLSRPSK